MHHPRYALWNSSILVGALCGGNIGSFSVWLCYLDTKSLWHPHTHTKKPYYNIIFKSEKNRIIQNCESSFFVNFPYFYFKWWKKCPFYILPPPPHSPNRHRRVEIDTLDALRCTQVHRLCYAFTRVRNFRNILDVYLLSTPRHFNLTFR